MSVVTRDAAGNEVRVERSGNRGRFYHWWYVCSSSGYLWPDGVWRLNCLNSETGEHGYCRTREEAESAARNHKSSHH